MVALNEYFRHAFSESMGRAEIPYQILNAKEILRALRARISHDHNISFSDVEICRATHRDEIPTDLRTVLASILDMFPPSPVREEPQALLQLDNADEEAPQPNGDEVDVDTL
jgi:hypothetical protein